MARVYGVASFSNGHGMIVNSFQKQTSTETAQARDESGRVIDEWAYSNTDEFTASGVYDDASNPPQGGDKFTFEGVDYLVKQVSKTENNTGAAELSIQCSRSDNAIIHPYGEEPSSSSSSSSAGA